MMRPYRAEMDDETLSDGYTDADHQTLPEPPADEWDFKVAALAEEARIANAYYASKEQNGGDDESGIFTTDGNSFTSDPESLRHTVPYLMTNTSAGPPKLPLDGGISVPISEEASFEESSSRKSSSPSQPGSSVVSPELLLPAVPPHHGEPPGRIVVQHQLQTLTPSTQAQPETDRPRPTRVNIPSRVLADDHHQSLVGNDGGGGGGGTDDDSLSGISTNDDMPYVTYPSMGLFQGRKNMASPPIVGSSSAGAADQRGEIASKPSWGAFSSSSSSYDTAPPHPKTIVTAMPSPAASSHASMPPQEQQQQHRPMAPPRPITPIQIQQQPLPFPSMISASSTTSSGSGRNVAAIHRPANGHVPPTTLLGPASGSGGGNDDAYSFSSLESFPNPFPAPAPRGVSASVNQTALLKRHPYGLNSSGGGSNSHLNLHLHPGSSDGSGPFNKSVQGSFYHTSSGSRRSEPLSNGSSSRHLSGAAAVATLPDEPSLEDGSLNTYDEDPTISDTLGTDGAATMGTDTDDQRLYHANLSVGFDEYSSATDSSFRPYPVNPRMAMDRDYFVHEGESSEDDYYLQRNHPRHRHNASQHARSMPAVSGGKYPVRGGPSGGRRWQSSRGGGGARSIGQHSTNASAGTPTEFSHMHGGNHTTGGITTDDDSAASGVYSLDEVPYGVANQYYHPKYGGASTMDHDYGGGHSDARRSAGRMSAVRESTRNSSNELSGSNPSKSSNINTSDTASSSSRKRSVGSENNAVPSLLGPAGITLVANAKTISPSSTEPYSPTADDEEMHHPHLRFVAANDGEDEQGIDVNYSDLYRRDYKYSSRSSRSKHADPSSAGPPPMVVFGRVDPDANDTFDPASARRMKLCQRVCGACSLYRLIGVLLVVFVVASAVAIGSMWANRSNQSAESSLTSNGGAPSAPSLPSSPTFPSSPSLSPESTLPPATSPSTSSQSEGTTLAPSPFDFPSMEQSGSPSENSSLGPTLDRSLLPTSQRTESPTTANPTIVDSSQPSSVPTLEPTPGPTPIPTLPPTWFPTHAPFVDSTPWPTQSPSTPLPTPLPTLAPTLRLTQRPTPRPTRSPTRRPTPRPTTKPVASSDIESLILSASPKTSTALSDPVSPQAMAVDWMKNHGGTSSLPDWRQLQLWTTVTFGIATSVQAWTKRSGWLGDSLNECAWYGIQCDGSSQITSMDLRSNGLLGTMIPEIFILRNSLNVFNVSTNGLKGTLPTEIGQLNNMQKFHIQANSFSGHFPNTVGQMLSLTELRLDWNDFIGTFPSSVGNLNNLQQLIMYSNEFTGTLNSVCGISTLTKLELDCMEITSNCWTTCWYSCGGSTGVACP